MNTSKTMKNKTLIFVSCAIIAFCTFAGLQKERHQKDQILNTTMLVTDVSFREDDPIFTNWVVSAEFRNIPRLTSEKYNTEYEPGKTNAGNRTTMYVGNDFSGTDIKKNTKILDMYDVHDKLVIETPNAEAGVYKCEYVDGVLSNKCGKVDLTHIEPLSPSATTAEIVAAVKSLAEALGRGE